MLSDRLLAILACPVCGASALRLDVEEADGDVLVKGGLGCPDCKRWYHVTDDIPSMMPPELASSLKAADQTWAGWRIVMEEFLIWRDDVWSDPERAAERRESALQMHRAFLDFCELPDEGVCLEIGCGTGRLADLVGEGVWYCGIDPLPGGRSPGKNALPELMPMPSREVSLVQAVGEVLPFVNECFDIALIAGSLDHCRDPNAVLAEAARVLKPAGRLAVLQGLSRSGKEGGVLSRLRGLASQLAGVPDPSARKTHMRTYQAGEVEALLSGLFEIEATAEHSRRLFVRATSRGAGGR